MPCFAFEEACKAAWCALVLRDLFDPNAFKAEVFRWHLPKTFLFHALAGGGIIRNPQTNLLQFHGSDLTKEKLKAIRGGESPETRAFESDRQAGLYVDMFEDAEGETWKSPRNTFGADAMARVYRYVHRMSVMLAICDMLLGFRTGEPLSGIRVEEVGGTWSVYLDTQ